MVVTTIKGRRGQHRRRTYVGYTTCLLFVFGCYLFGLPHAAWLWRRDNDEEDGGDDDGTRGQHCRRMYYLSVGFGFFLNLFVVSHMLAMADGQ